MRTTLTIDDDVLAAARDLAKFHRNTVGEMVSSLVRQGLCPTAGFVETRNGVTLLPGRHDVAPGTLELVNQLRDELP